MDASQPPELRRSLFQRRTTRRAVLAGGAAIAAAGTAATVFGISQFSGGSGASPASASGAVGGAAATPTVDPNAPIADPRRRAAHLLRRAGFGGTLAEIAAFSTLTREQAADRLLNYEAIDNSALDQRIAVGNFDLSGAKPAEFVRWWLTRMAYTARPLEERMTLIWHGLLTSQLSKVGSRFSILLLHQNELYRQNALPKWDDFIKAVSKDPGMMVYLDTVLSSKAHPNENYAREQMELFTMGIGNYSEADVREAARAYTGYRMTRPPVQASKGPFLNYNPSFLLLANQHDSGTKTFLGKTGNFGGDDIIDIIMASPAAGKHICTRLFTEFANPNPSPQTIDKLVGVWNQSGHQIKEIVRAILVSDEFYSEGSYRSIVRSPINFVIGAIRGLQLDANAQTARRMNLAAGRYLVAMGQTPFEPPNVAGWPGGPFWLSSSTFFSRINFLDILLGGTGKNAVGVPPLAGATTTAETVDTALQLFLDGNVGTTTRQAIIDYAGTVIDPRERAATVAYLVLASPQYQLV